jgi:hypothetical protein
LDRKLRTADISFSSFFCFIIAASEAKFFWGRGVKEGLGFLISTSRTDLLSSVNASEMTFLDLGMRELDSFLTESIVP